MPIKKVFLYDQSLKTNDIYDIERKIEKGKYTDTIFYGPTTAGKSAWIYIPGDILKTDTDHDHILTGFYDFTDLYKKIGGQWEKQDIGGYYTKFSNKSSVVSRISFKLFNDPEDIAEAYLIACRRNNDYSPSIMEAQLMSQKDVEIWMSNHNNSKIWYNVSVLLIWGFLLLTIITLGFRAFNSKSKEYFIFMLGNIFIAINFLIVFIVEPSNIQFYPFDDPVIAVALADPTIIIGIGGIILSIKYFYKGSNFLVFSKRLPFISFGLCIIISIALFILNYFYHLFYIANAITYVFLTLLIVVIYLILFFKRKLLDDRILSSTFLTFFIGSIFFAFFSLMDFALSTIFEQNTSYIGLSYLHSLPQAIGIAIYNIFVLLALNNRDFKEAKEASILKEKAYQLEIEVMQNSLNPHFIFNSLNLIDYFIYKQKLPEARMALYQFSDLLRTIIDKTSKSKILLSEELKVIELYLKIECTRKTDLLNYSIQISEEIDVNHVFIPSLI